MTATVLESGLVRTGTPVLEVEDLRVSFPTENGRLDAVRGLSYQVARGEVLAIVGESGSGKSVSSLAVLGLLPPNARAAGSIRYQGRELLGLNDREMSEVRGAGISMVFQDPLSALTPVYRVGQAIASAIRVHQDVSREVAAARAVELLDLVGIPDPKRRAQNFPHEFSGGMRQRVVIAMAIANDPDVIIADEPTTALDVTVQAQILEVLKTAQRATGSAIVLITHDLGIVAGFADRATVMYAGRPVETGDVGEVFAAPRMPYTAGLLGSLPRLDGTGRERLTAIPGSPPSLLGLAPGCPFAPRCTHRIGICTEREPELLAVAGQHRAACHRSGEAATLLRGAGAQRAGDADSVTGVDGTAGADGRAELTREGRSDPTAAVTAAGAEHSPASASDGVAREARETVLDIRNLIKHHPVTKGSTVRKRVGTIHAVDGITFDIRNGESLAVVGESGCGKTTTVMEILRLRPPEGGSVSVLGRDLGELSSGLGARRRSAEVRRGMAAVFQDPLASLDPRLPVGDILGEPLRAHGVRDTERSARVQELLRLVGLEPEHANRYPQEFSGGQRQRVAIARALALEPRLVILDEPVSALDVSVRAGVLNLLADLKARLGLAYLFVSHDLAVVRHVADRVAVMHLGRIVEIGDAASVFTDPRHPYTQALLSAVPIPDPVVERRRRRIVLEGDPPSAVVMDTDRARPQGCRFRGRCPLYQALDDEARSVCDATDPELVVQSGDHQAACHHVDRREAVTGSAM